MEVSKRTASAISPKTTHSFAILGHGFIAFEGIFCGESSERENEFFVERRKKSKTNEDASDKYADWGSPPKIDRDNVAINPKSERNRLKESFSVKNLIMKAKCSGIHPAPTK